MKFTSRKLIVIIFAVVILAAGILVAAYKNSRSIKRDVQYRELIANFQRAVPREKIKRQNGNLGWDFQISIPENQTIAQVQAGAFPGIVRIKYGDEIGARPLYKYVDYSTPVEIRTSGSILYVHWSEVLFETDHWLLAYDLESREELVRRRIDPKDLSKP